MWTEQLKWGFNLSRNWLTKKSGHLHIHRPRKRQPLHRLTLPAFHLPRAHSEQSPSHPRQPWRPGMPWTQPGTTCPVSQSSSGHTRRSWSRRAQCPRWTWATDVEGKARGGKAEAARRQSCRLEGWERAGPSWRSGRGSRRRQSSSRRSSRTCRQRRLPPDNCDKKQKKGFEFVMLNQQEFMIYFWAAMSTEYRCEC